MPKPAPVRRPTSDRSASTRNASSRRCWATMIAPRAVQGKRSAVQTRMPAACGWCTRCAKPGAVAAHNPNSATLMPIVNVKAVSKCSWVTSARCTSASWKSMLTSDVEELDQGEGDRKYAEVGGGQKASVDDQRAEGDQRQPAVLDGAPERGVRGAGAVHQRTVGASSGSDHVAPLSVAHWPRTRSTARRAGVIQAPRPNRRRTSAGTALRGVAASRWNQARCATASLGGRRSAASARRAARKQTRDRIPRAAPVIEPELERDQPVVEKRQLPIEDVVGREPRLPGVPRANA